jgi:SAM-dependent methyltransferase
MIRHRRAERPPAVVGDALALPFRTDAFDAAVSAFSLNHLPDPRAGLAECRRVTRPGGTLLAATFPADGGHPAKAAVEAVLAGFGYRRPRWYVDFQERTAALTAEPGLLATTASDAGLDEVEVRRIEVGAGLDDPDRVVGWRLDMPHTIGFVASLEPDVRARLRESAAAALPSPLPVAVSVLVLLAHVP